MSQIITYGKHKEGGEIHKAKRFGKALIKSTTQEMRPLHHSVVARCKDIQILIMARHDGVIPCAALNAFCLSYANSGIGKGFYNFVKRFAPYLEPAERAEFADNMEDVALRSPESGADVAQRLRVSFEERQRSRLWSFGTYELTQEQFKAACKQSNSERRNAKKRAKRKAEGCQAKEDVARAAQIRKGVCEFLKVDRCTLYRWEKAGLIDPVENATTMAHAIVYILGSTVLVAKKKFRSLITELGGHIDQGLVSGLTIHSIEKSLLAQGLIEAKEVGHSTSRSNLRGAADQLVSKEDFLLPEFEAGSLILMPPSEAIDSEKESLKSGRAYPMKGGVSEFHKELTGQC